MLDVHKSLEDGRKLRKKTQKAVAAELKLSRRQYQRIESGEGSFLDTERALDVLGMKLLIINKDQI